MIYTTLNEIRGFGPCRDGWTQLLSHLGKTEADDEPLPLVTVLDSNGLYDTIWCLRVCPDVAAEFARWCAGMADAASAPMIDEAAEAARFAAFRASLCYCSARFEEAAEAARFAAFRASLCYCSARFEEASGAAVAEDSMAAIWSAEAAEAAIDAAFWSTSDDEDFRCFLQADKLREMLS